MTEINDVTSLTKSVNRIAKALDQDFSKESLTESLDAIADYIEENGTGGGESSAEIITVTQSYIQQISEYRYSADKSFDEVNAMFADRTKPLIVLYKDLSGNVFVCPFSESWDDFDTGGKEAFLFTNNRIHINTSNETTRAKINEIQVTIRRSGVSVIDVYCNIVAE